MRWQTTYGSKESVFYSDKEVLPMTAREKERYLSKPKQVAAEKRASKKAEADNNKRKAEQVRFF